MSSVNYTVKLDEARKKQAESVLKELGLNLSVAINAYINAIARKGEIPFKLSLNDNSNAVGNIDDFFIYKNFIELMSIANSQSKDKNTKRYTLEQVLSNFDSRVNNI